MSEWINFQPKFVAFSTSSLERIVNLFPLYRVPQTQIELILHLRKELTPDKLQELLGETDNSLDSNGLIIHQCSDIDALVTDPLVVFCQDLYLDLEKMELALSVYEKIKSLSSSVIVYEIKSLNQIFEIERELRFSCHSPKFRFSQLRYLNEMEIIYLE